jgi:uncharacterized cupredoxin-like copper-binding protein
MEMKSLFLAIWQFTKAGEFDFACPVPGHLEAGMVGKISVGP